MKNCNPVRGAYDYLPKQARIREIVRQIILQNYQSNGFNLISTPILESLDLLNMSEGGDNLKLMFKTIKRGEKLDLEKPNLTVDDIVEEGLRYDLTVPLARFYSNNKDKLPRPFKSIQIGEAFRAERPQKGRNRQFVQCDIDIFGDGSINAELELLRTAIETYEKLGFNHLTLKINNRAILNSLVIHAGFKPEDVGTVCVTLDKLDKISMSGVIMELVDKGFATEYINKLVDIMNEVLEKGLEATKSYGADETSVEDLNYLIEALNKLTSNKHEIKFDTTIVRGQGYYTGTVYEFYAEGFSGAIGGGGRYDKMVGKITGVDTSAVGVSMGFEPICMLLEEKNATFDAKQNLALLYDEDDDVTDIFALKDELRKQYNVSLFAKPKNLRNFYEKIGEVANYVTSVKDQQNHIDIKHLD